MEGQTRTIKLPGEDYKTVGRYVDFVYGKGLESQDIRSPKWDKNPYSKLVDLYLLGEHVLNKSIRNAVIEEVLRLSTILYPDGCFKGPKTQEVNRIFDAPPESSPLRCLMVDMQIYWGTELWVDDGETLHPSYLFELASAFCKGASDMFTSDDDDVKVLYAKNYFV